MTEDLILSLISIIISSIAIVLTVINWKSIKRLGRIHDYFDMLDKENERLRSRK